MANESNVGRRTRDIEPEYQFEVNIPPLRATVHLRYDRRYRYIRIRDYVFDAQISSHNELSPLLPGSILLPRIDELLHEVIFN